MAFNLDFDIPSLRKQSVMQNWSQPMGGGYDWSAAPIDYSSGEMPRYQAPPENFAPQQPQSPMEQIGQNPATFGGSAPTPTGPTQGAPPSQIAPPSVNTYGGGDSAKKLMETINSIYTPEYTDRDRLRALMDAAPERESPGWGRGLAAIGVGLGTKDMTQALANMEGVNYAPHRRAMADWTAKADPFYKTADLENRSNINERTLAGNVATAQTNADRYEAQAATAAERNRITEIKAMADKAKAERWTVKVEGPDVYMYPPDPSYGPRRRMGSSSGMSTEDKINLEGAWKVAASEASGASAVERARMGGVGRIVGSDGKVYEPDPDKPGSYIPTQGLPSGTPTKIGTPSSAGGGRLEMERAEQDRLRDLYEANTNSSKWVIKDGTRFSMKKRPKLSEGSYFGFGKVTQEEVDSWDDAKEIADPSYKRPAPAPAAKPSAAAKPAPDLNFSNLPTPKVKPESTTGLGPPNLPKVAAPPAPAAAGPEPAKGRIKIYKDGKYAGTISNDSKVIQEAIGRGYTMEG